MNREELETMSKEELLDMLTEEALEGYDKEELIEMVLEEYGE